MKTRIDGTSAAGRPLAALLARGVLALALAAAALPARALGLDELMSLLARQRSGEARFTEQRHVAGLDAPLASSGTLSFEAPDRLARRVLEPRPESFVVDGNTVTLTRAGRTRTVALDSVPELAAVIEAMRGTLTGNGAALQRHFRARVEGGADAWTLALEPLSLDLTSHVRAVTITGRRGEVRGVEMQYAGGDWSMMVVEPVRAPAARK